MRLRSTPHPKTGTRNLPNRLRRPLDNDLRSSKGNICNTCYLVIAKR